MASKKIKEKLSSELRQDPVSGDWVLVSLARGRRDVFKPREKMVLPLDKCPFEDPPKFENEPPVLVYQNEKKDDWFLQILPNKYPAVRPDNRPHSRHDGVFESQAGFGFHEIIILRDHGRFLADYSVPEIDKILRACQERYQSLASEKDVGYISIFHNHGREAGSTVAHLHSQILALPIVPPDISHSVNGSNHYFHEHNRCIHCEMIKQELKDGRRIIYENESMVAFAPFASRSDFEIRIFPKKHFAYFEKIGDKERHDLAESFHYLFPRIYKKLNDPPFNFFIHTAPVKDSYNFEHYHWHLEILPRLEITGGFELTTGLNIVSVPPEEVPGILNG